ncbi:MAG: hypothetical protein QM503_14010 [Bacteroidota bacterium]
MIFRIKITTFIILPFLIFLIISITGCNMDSEVNAGDILLQLPENNRVALVPNLLASLGKSKFNTISFDDMALMQDKSGNKYSEKKFYEVARSLGVQYILISSDMTNSNNVQFPWMTNKNFRVCPGTIDHKTKTYYTLLVWDNSKNSYHFFKFLY